MAFLARMIALLLLTASAISSASATPSSSNSNQLTYNALVVGYGPFMNYTNNPAALTALALDNQCYPLSELLLGASNMSRLCFAGPCQK